MNIEDYTDLAHYYANKSSKRYLQGVELDDLYQVAMIGIWIASKNYDPNMGAFSTYAHRFVQGEINDLVYKITSVDGTKQRTPRIKEELLGDVSELEPCLYEDTCFDDLYLNQYIHQLSMPEVHKEFFRRMVVDGDTDATKWYKETAFCSRQQANNVKKQIRERIQIC
tara:strand:+ start:2417 stop:2920 length:504 start_codon:yes stop_codon:yes gene_type:complete